MPGFGHPGLLLVVALLAIGPGPARGDAGVMVTIWERLPERWDWKAPRETSDDRFEIPAMGFVHLPSKHDARGIEVDRSTGFAVHAEAGLLRPEGPHRLVLRSRGAARLLVDGRLLAETKPISPNSAGHEEVPDVPPPVDPRWRPLAAGDQEQVVSWHSDGKPHRVELWALVGGKRLRPETGETSVSVAAPGGLPILIGGTAQVTLTDDGWEAFAGSERERLAAFDARRRRASAASDNPYWDARHEQARVLAAKRAIVVPRGDGNLVDRFIEARRKADGGEPPRAVDDAAFFRRLALDTIGVVPEAAEVAAFLSDPNPGKRARAVAARLDDPRWADGWMGYWQDVLAENPGILKPTLNNTGPFRRYLHSAFLDGKAFDRFATELIRMEGSRLGGGPAGFGIASENDAPMAAKAHILAKAFLAVDMKCARCHDAPSHPYEQGDLFGLAAMLEGKAVAIPATSTVRRQEGGRPPAVSVSLRAGEAVKPHWNLPEVGDETLADGFLPDGAGPRERLAALVTSPRNPRFAPVIVNRLWARYLGRGIVTPVDDWDDDPSDRFPELLDALAVELLSHDYNLKHVARLILESRAYQAAVLPVAGEGAAAVAPARRRMSAEQILDSLYAAVGKPFDAEELNLDPDGRRPPSEFLNLGTPRRAWEFTSTSNERDRPALSLPVVQGLVDVLQTFGWRPSRQDPITARDEATTPLQPALLANGVAASRAIRLTDDGAITPLCLIDQPAEALIQTLTLRVLSRPPTQAETRRLVAYLGDTYAGRIVPGARPTPKRSYSRRVSWSNHLNPEATRIQLEREQQARAGDPPTARLTPAFRERMEDIVWALVNSPEFLYLP